MVKMDMLDGFDKVNDNVTLYRFHNGWMVEVSGQAGDEWPTRKILCQDLTEVQELVIAYSMLPLND